MNAIHAQLKIKRGIVVDVEIPTDEEIERIAMRMHKGGKPCLENILGWKVFYRPRLENAYSLTSVNPFTGEQGEKTAPTKTGGFAEFTFGYNAPWSIILSWKAGDDEPPEWFRYEDKLIQSPKLLSMLVKFDTIKVASQWDRKQLAKLWGYNGRQGLDHGIVTPKNDNKIILFITREKQSHSKQYKDVLEGNTVRMDGQPSHRTDERLIHAAERSDEMHLFYRDRPLQQFTYYGRVYLQSHENHTDQPSKFTFGLCEQPKATQQLPNDLPEPPARCEVQVSRIIRDTPLARELKSLYGFACQVCGCNFRIEPAPNSFYIEVHHVRPLGGDHAGSDSHANMLVLCPNHHAMFDYGIPRFLSTQRIEIAGVIYDLTTKHELAPDSIEYHNAKLQNRNA